MQRLKSHFLLQETESDESVSLQIRPSPRLLRTFTRFLHFCLIFPRWLENLPFPRLEKDPIWHLERIVCVTVVINHFRLMNLGALLWLLEQWPLYKGVFSFGCFSLWREGLTGSHFLLAKIKLATLFIFPLPAQLLHTSTWCHLQEKAAVTIENSNLLGPNSTFLDWSFSPILCWRQRSDIGDFSALDSEQNDWMTVKRT